MIFCSMLNFFKKVKVLFLFGILLKLSKCTKNIYTEIQAQKALTRTLTKIQSMGDEGRIIVLICKATCLKQRAQVILI